MKIPNDGRATIFIDIDRTIVDDKGIPFLGAVECIKKLSEKVNIYIWSAGGFFYANAITEKLGLSDFVCGAMSKPNYTIDDLYVDLDFSQSMYPDWKFIESFEKELEGKFIRDINLL